MCNKNTKKIQMGEFSCVRLSEDHNNKSLISGFSSKTNPGLAEYLQKYAWKEDKDNYRAYYLVKDGNRIVLYFSLQCGLLAKCKKKQLYGVKHVESDGEITYYIDDDKIDVSKVIPGIEIAHFCANDSYRNKVENWEITYGPYSYTVGKYVFYKYIAPRIIEISQNAGVQYVYLFCADDGTDKLTNYYTQQLNFSIMDDMSCIRPDYDGLLECLTIKIGDLVKDTIFFNDVNKYYSVESYLDEHGTLSLPIARKELGIVYPKRLFTDLVNRGVLEWAHHKSVVDVVRVGFGSED